MAERVLIGKRGTDYGLYVSKPTVDVTSATDAELMFNSDDTESFNVLQSGTVTVTMPSPTEGEFSSADSSWEAYSSLSLSYPPLIIYMRIDGTAIGSIGQATYAREATYIEDAGERVPVLMNTCNFNESHLTLDHANKQFKITGRRFKSEWSGRNFGLNGTNTFKYFILAAGDTSKSTLVSAGP